MTASPSVSSSSSNVTTRPPVPGPRDGNGPQHAGREDLDGAGDGVRRGSGGRLVGGRREPQPVVAARRRARRHPLGRISLGERRAGRAPDGVLIDGLAVHLHDAESAQRQGAPESAAELVLLRQLGRVEGRQPGRAERDAAHRSPAGISAVTGP